MFVCSICGMSSEGGDAGMSGGKKVAINDNSASTSTSSSTINLNNSVNPNSLISNNIEILRNKIRVLIDDNRFSSSYANPARFLLNASANDEREEWENGGEEDGVDEDVESMLTSTTTTTPTIEELRATESSLHEKIDAELDNAVSKEVLTIAEHEFNEKKMEILPLSYDINKLKSHIIYRVNGVNLNSIKFASFIDTLSQLYDKFIVVKPTLSDPYSDEVFIIFGNKVADEVKSSNLLPINRENYIDFLYSMYSYAIYVLNLINDVKYKTYLTKSEFVKLPPDVEYKFLVEKCKNKLKELNLLS